MLEPRRGGNTSAQGKRSAALGRESPNPEALKGRDKDGSIPHISFIVLDSVLLE
jgi:hypothetical protein